MAKKISLDEVTRNWVSDRLENEEPLFWGEFIKFMIDVEGGETDNRQLKKWRSKSYRKAVKARYSQKKKRLAKQYSRIGKY